MCSGSLISCNSICHSHCFLRCCGPIQKTFASAYILECFLLVVSKFQAVHWYPCSMLSWFFLWKMNVRNILPVFHMWVSVSFHLLGRLLFVWGTFFYHLFWESCNCICICVGSFLVPLGNWIGLYVCFVPVLCFFVMIILSCNLNLDIVVPLAVLVFSLGCLWLFGVIWTFTWVFEFFSISMKKLNAIGILMESVLNL